MSLDKFSWYINRLRAMSIPEIRHRIVKKINQDIESKRYKDNKYINQINQIDQLQVKIFEDRLVSIFDPKYIDIDNYNISDEIDIFGEIINLKSEINWHKGNISSWDKEKYSNYINFKNTDDIGDIRYTWEINRHLFFPKLALNFKKSNDKYYLELLEMHFYNWIKDNPFLKGVNWSSPMEIAIRSYQWIITYSIIKDEISEILKIDLLNSIVNSIQYVRNNYSLYSSANNHLILEAVYCGIIGYIIDPIYNNNYLDESYEIIEREILLQNTEDGVNKEQATHYHAFVLDAFFQYAFFLRKLNRKFPYENILLKMSEFIGLLNLSGRVIEFGDSDDAKLISFNLNSLNYYDYVLQMASIYFNTKFLNIESLFEEVKFISQNKIIKAKEYEYKKFYVYKNGGYAIFNIENDFLLFDIGELGFGSIAAHGHADALSIVYSNNKNQVLIDPGTYIYNIESNWRDYFRKTSSHNTLALDNKDQSQIKGPFLWGSKAKVDIIEYGENEELIYVTASHDGYSPNIHRRSIMYIKKESIFIIADRFKGTANINYILDKDLKINKLDSNKLEIKHKYNDIFITFNNEYSICEKWISNKFLHKEQTDGIEIINDFDKNADLYTIISKEKVEIDKNKIKINDYIVEYIGNKEIRRYYDKNC